MRGMITDARVAGNQVLPIESGKWAVSTPWSIAAGAGINGGACIQKDANTSVSQLSYPTAWGLIIPVPPSRGLRIAFSVKTTTDWNYPTNNSKIRIAKAEGNDLLFAISAPQTNGVWQKIVTTRTIPAGITNIAIQLFGDNTLGTIWWDQLDVRLA